MTPLEKVVEINIWHWLLMLDAKHTEKYEEIWSKIKDLVRSIYNDSDNYCEEYMENKFNLDDELPLK